MKNPPNVTLTALPDSVVSGGTSVLSWSATNATGCTAGGAWSGDKNTSGSQSISAITSTGTYDLTCTGAGGTTLKSVSIAVQSSPAAPVLAFTVDATTIAYNSAATFTWSSSDATSCAASGAWSGGKTISGTQTIAALISSGTYTLTCTGAGGSISKSLSVNVQAALLPTVSLAAAPLTVTSGGSTTLTWSSTNATSCSASGAWSGNKAISGNETRTSLTATGTYTLSCTGAGGSANQSVTVTVQAAPVPTVTLSANPLSVAYSASTTLTWSSSNATSCSASGAWSGSKVTSGNELMLSLTATGTYTLTCTGAGGSASQSVTVIVQAAPVPTVTLSANPLSVAYGASTTLTWSSSNATSCSATGGWSGSKTATGNELMSSLTATGIYTLACSGAGGSASASVTVTVVSGTTGSITGTVDSSRINRAGVNKVYLYNGTVTPDDYDGDSGDPVATTLVSQDSNACTFSYAFSGVAPGNYTIAFTGQAASDTVGVNDAINFIGTTNITVASALTQNFGAARVLKVGSGKTYAKPSAAYAAAVSGDVIEIDAGVYQNDVVVWRQNNLTLRGVGGRAHVQSTQIIPYTPGTDSENGMAIWVLRGSNIAVENMEFSGSTVPDTNGAGIRPDGGDAIICNSSFHDNENGILGDAPNLTIEYSEFNHNGIVGDGYTHNVYIGAATNKLVFRHNYSHRAHIGHELKTRAKENHILYNRLMNEDGDGSYNIDVPNGGLTYIIGNLIQQGPNTDNSTIVSYGAEGLSTGRTHQLHLVNNTLVNDRSAGTFVAAAAGTALLIATNNLFVGTGTDISGATAVTRTSNLATNAPGLVNRTAYDYRLLSSSPAINAGSDPGNVAGYDLRPAYQYLDPTQRAARTLNGAYDIGAYEFMP